MRFELTDEQQLIAASASDWLHDHCDFRQRKAGLLRDGGNPATWRAMAGLGWLGLPLPGAYGGLDMGAMECGLLAQALGRHLVTEPLIDSTLQAARLLALTGSPQQRERWLPGVVDGTHRLALAHAEGSRLPWDVPQATARRDGPDWLLSGVKRHVLSAPGAVRWIVSARLQQAGPQAVRSAQVAHAEHRSATVALFLVDPGAAGVALDAYDTSDGGRAGDLVFDAVRLDASSRLGVDESEGEGEGHVDALATLHRVLAEGIVARCWWATGAMQAAFEQTTQYVQQRRQFGQSLSAFQVVQHRLAEMAVLCAEAQAACELASIGLAQLSVPSAAASRDIAALVKSKVARAARYVSQECVQLHGAMGVCEELPIASAFRALMAFAQMGGDSASHALAVGRNLLADGRFALSSTLGEAQQPTSVTAATTAVTTVTTTAATTATTTVQKETSA